MTSIEKKVHEALAIGESQTAEFKLGVPHADQAAVLINAFANTLGGVIIIGADDRGNVTGLNPAEVKRARSTVERASSSQRPPVDVEIAEVLIDGKRILACLVPEAGTRIVTESGSAHGRVGASIMHFRPRASSVLRPRQQYNVRDRGHVKRSHSAS